MGETRTASRGQLRELAATVVQGIPTDLPSDIAQGHISNKGLVHHWLALGLTRDLSRAGLSKIQALLEGRLKTIPCFSTPVRLELERQGYEMVQIPEGITLTSLIEESKLDSFLLPDPDYLESLDTCPTQAREVAWYPSDLLFSDNKCIGEQERSITSYSEMNQEWFGEVVEAVLPTVEEAAFLSLKYQAMAGRYTQERHAGLLCLTATRRWIRKDNHPDPRFRLAEHSVAVNFLAPSKTLLVDYDCHLGIGWFPDVGLLRFVVPVV